MGTYYNGGAKTYHSLRDNLPDVLKSYSISPDGFFGSIGKAGVKEIRQLDTNDVVEESKKFYDKLTFGGIETKLPNGNGTRTELRDGTIIVYREITSTVNSPAVEINVRKSNGACNIAFQKIHFEKIGD